MAGDYRFPNWPVIPTKPAVFDDRSLVKRKPDCPWAWSLATVATLGVLAACSKGILW